MAMWDQDTSRIGMAAKNGMVTGLYFGKHLNGRVGGYDISQIAISGWKS